jgi:hypothetical protein
MRFLGLKLGDWVPDAKIVWLFREQLTQTGLIEELPKQLERFLGQHQFATRKKVTLLMPVLYQHRDSATVGKRTR